MGGMQMMAAFGQTQEEAAREKDLEKDWGLKEKIFGKFYLGGNNAWWKLGIEAKPREHPGKLYMDEAAVRVRAGLLNSLGWYILFATDAFTREPPTSVQPLQETVKLGLAVWLVGFDMLMASVFGIIPFAPIGLLGSVIAHFLAPGSKKPLWKPAGPKRFAWMIGFALVTTCLVANYFENRTVTLSALLMCNGATWLEASCGFCVGCWIYNNIVVRVLYGKEAKAHACKECEL